MLTIERVEFPPYDPGIGADQRAFLKAAAVHKEIRLGHTLWESVFPIFSNPPSGFHDNPDSEEAEAWSQTLNLAIWDWGRRHNLCVDWVFAAAYAELQAWALHANPTKNLRTDFTTLHPVFADTPKFRWPHWFPALGETEQEYKKRVRAEFNNSLRTYLLEIKKGQKAGRDRRTRKVNADQRFTWAALRVCLGWTYEQIAGECDHRDGITVQSVHDTVGNICRRLELSI